MNWQDYDIRVCISRPAPGTGASSSVLPLQPELAGLRRPGRPSRPADTQPEWISRYPVLENCGSIIRGPGSQFYAQRLRRNKG